MVAAASISEDTLQTASEITVQTIEELSQKVPKSFFEFLKVKVSYQNSEAVSVIDMLKRLGSLGYSALTQSLSRMNIAFSEPVCDFALSKRERARAIKNRVLKSFRSSYRQSDANSQASVCSICMEKAEKDSGYPVLLYERFLPNFMNPEFRKYGALGIRICPHLVHCECWKKSGCKTFPVDNRECTAVLGTSCDTIDVVFWSFKKALVSFACELAVLEIRHRNRPQSLDIESNAILLRTLWNSICALWSKKVGNTRI